MIGKSSLILNSILPFITVTGGFMCQRLLEGGNTKAFCLTPIEQVSSSIEEYSSEKHNIFLENIHGKWQRNEAVFSTAGVALLSDLAGKRIVVLDEIGGMELLVKPFREKLYEVLSGGIPCLGVIKSYNNKARMQKNIGIEPEYTILHNMLFSDIEKKFNGIILDADIKSMDFIKNNLKSFLNKNI